MIMLTPDDLAAKLGISPRTVYRLLHSDQLPFAMKIGGRWFFENSDVEKWLLDKKSKPYRKQKSKME